MFKHYSKVPWGDSTNQILSIFCIYIWYHLVFYHDFKLKIIYKILTTHHAVKMGQVWDLQFKIDTNWFMLLFVLVGLLTLKRDFNINGIRLRLVLWCLTSLDTICLSYCGVIGGGNRIHRWKAQTCRKSLTNFITYHI